MQTELEAQYFQQSQPGILRVAGPDQIDFLQRQTSNDLAQLSAGGALGTVLTSPTARILDVFYLLVESDDEGKGIRLVSLTGNGARMAKYFKGRIFFMDKVAVEDLSSQYAQFNLYGNGVAKALESIGISQLPKSGDFQRVDFLAETLLILRHHPQLGLGYLALIPQSVAEAFAKRLDEIGLERSDPETYEISRVENGIPAAKNEICEDYTPFEVGLDSLVSTAKGCYTGQEILARQVTYDKIVRKLAGLKSSAPLPVGTPLKQDGKPAGSVTSSVISPRLGPIALAVLRRPYHEPGTRLQAQSDSQAVDAIVSELPFD